MIFSFISLNSVAFFVLFFSFSHSLIFSILYIILRGHVAPLLLYRTMILPYILYGIDSVNLSFLFSLFRFSLIFIPFSDSYYFIYGTSSTVVLFRISHRATSVFLTTSFLVVAFGSSIFTSLSLIR